MFTECPECSTAFHVTAKVLQQAGGRVRCGGCGNAFSAIDHLTEDVPGPNGDGAAAPDAAATDESPADEKLAETSRRLLETLDELAGPDEVRIEDTGIEWRVLDDGEGITTEAASDQPEASQESLDLEDAAEKRREERRYDDNTPLPDEFDDEEHYEYAAPPQRRASDHEDQDTAEFDEKQSDLALSEPEDWTDLLDEVIEEGAASGNIPLEVEEELAAIHSELSAKEEQVSTKSTATETQPADLDSQFEMQAEAMGLEISGVHEVAEEEGIAAGAASADAEEADLTDAVPLLEDEEIAAEFEDVESEKKATSADDRESTGEFEAKIDLAARALVDGNEEETEKSDKKVAARTAPADTDESALDEALELSLENDEEEVAPAAEKIDFAATLIGMDDPSKLFDEDSADVETIVMEGDFVGSSETARLEAEKEAQKRFRDAGDLVDTYAANRGVRGGRRSTDPAGYGVIGGTMLLVLILVGQVMHAYREPLSTYGLFNQTLGPVYRMLGNPITPEWDIKGWQFEATKGSVAEEEDVLTIFSRIGNNSQLPLPYPLVHVSLTDRWEEIIGSRILEPNEYLAGDLDPSNPVIPGENFTAVITIDEPSVEATGFKLNVCYRVGPGRVRCATEDFKN